MSPEQAFELDRTAVVLRIFACLALSAIGLFLAAELFNPDVLLSLLPAAIPALAGLFILVDLGDTLLSSLEGSHLDRTIRLLPP